MSFLIEVAVEEHVSTTERGRILERFSRAFLESQNFSVSENVRLTSTEIDLLGIDRATGERIFVECKAYRSTVSAEILHKLLGNVVFANYASGWLISTHNLSKDAKGFVDTWNTKPENERRRLRIYDPERLVDHLVRANIVVHPDSIAMDKSKLSVGSEALLVLAQTNTFWALPVIDRQSGIRIGSILFYAATGKQVTDPTTYALLSKTDCSCASLEWMTTEHDDTQAGAARVLDEFVSIVPVPVADSWADYRPSRPEDFIGRAEIQASFFEFLDRVRTGNSNTRLAAIKAPSGWGKSSSVLKIVARSKATWGRSKYFVFAVDSRAATSRRFPELAVIKAVQSAFEIGFIASPGALEFGGAASLLNTPAMRTIGDQLATEQKVICVFFDQFEEIIYKAELSAVFDEVQRVCFSIEESRANIVVAFSWKTDGVIPTEHRAYHMWHGLSDHRYELTLSPFSEQETALALGMLQRELGQQIIAPLKRFVVDNSQGLPWLVKKLLIHIFELLANGAHQQEIVNESFSIAVLFERDILRLSPREIACLRAVAQQSPAELFRMLQDFGDDIVSQLLDKRIIVRSGARLSVYWDIFRQFVLNGSTPRIPVTYVPQSEFGRYVRALALLNGRQEMSYRQIGAYLKIGAGAVDNLVRDLVNLGHAEAFRPQGKVRPAFTDEAQAIRRIVEFLKSHEVVRRLQEDGPLHSGFDESSFVEVYRHTLKGRQLRDATVSAYALRLLRWLVGLGIVVHEGSSYRFELQVRVGFQSIIALGSTRLRSTELFFGDVPFHSVVIAYEALSGRRVGRDEAVAVHGRKTCQALVKLGIMLPDGTLRMAAGPKGGTGAVAASARRTVTVQFVHSILGAKPTLSGWQVGHLLADHLGLKWSSSSCARIGNALRQWADWCFGEKLLVGHSARTHFGKSTTGLRLKLSNSRAPSGSRD